MECDFQVGDKVVCIHDYSKREPIYTVMKSLKIVLPVLDERYHLATVELCDCGGKHVLVTLKELVQPTGFKAKFFHTSFRKLLTIDDFKSVETDAPVDRIKEPEHA